MGSSPCRIFYLLSIIHPVVGKYFQVLAVHQEINKSKTLVVKKAWFLDLLCFVKFWAKNLVSVYVNEKFCNKDYFWTCSI